MSSRRSRAVRASLAALAVAVVLPVPADATVENPRSYVDQATGNDLNDCTFAHPCATFQQAHDVTKPGGEIDALGPGNYTSLTISKPITIDGNGTDATVTPAGYGVTVDLSSGSGLVVLRDIRINVAANDGLSGIRMVSGGTLITDNLRIFGGNEAGILLDNSQDPFSRLIVDDTKIEGAGGPGVAVQPSGARSARVTVRDSAIDANLSAGVRLKPTSGATARATVRNTHIDANYNGVVVDASGGTAVANVFRSAISDSGIDGGSPGVGVYAIGANALARISRNEIQTNQRGLQVLNGGRILSTGDNDIFGNNVDGAPTGTIGRK